ncbi:hypothetical protein [Nocardia arthritidis]|uniref:Uncharacterized protein n=1 Tax=Nocardia arthritidis TaxID=228602 RepID=A0A6G9YD14_9NOCA|nr:hypothetical protein [Nocardia arthritidis]QIS11165.1 hypothetical protein F5544_16430 [Nocardia arthritidis]
MAVDISKGSDDWQGGEIAIFAGPAIDARPAFGLGFWWVDYPDSRYCAKTGDPIIARPIDQVAMVSEINRLTTLTQRFYRENQQHDEYLRRHKLGK